MLGLVDWNVTFEALDRELLLFSDNQHTSRLGYATMGKQQRGASATYNADILEQVKTVLKDESVITHIADRIAAAVAKTILQRLDKLETVLGEKNEKICNLEQAVVDLEDKVDKLEQYSRRTYQNIWDK